MDNEDRFIKLFTSSYSLFNKILIISGQKSDNYDINT